MRPLRLLGVAAEAEGLRLRRSCGLVARRAGWLGGAAVFAVAALVLVHVAAVTVLMPPLGLAVACGIVALVDLVLACALVIVARHLRDPVAEEALLLRRASLAAAASGGRHWMPVAPVPIRPTTLSPSFVSGRPGPPPV